MAIRIKHKINVRVAEDTDMNNLLFAPKDDLAEVTIDAYEKVVSGTVKVLAAATEGLSFGDVTLPAKGLYLRVDSDCLVNINGLGTIQLRRSSTATGVVAKLAIEADINTVTITAPGGNDVRGVWCVWGDAAA
jgi:hypothetical protein